jgi:hypothetical protein
MSSARPGVVSEFLNPRSAVRGTSLLAVPELGLVQRRQDAGDGLVELDLQWFDAFAILFGSIEACGPDAVTCQLAQFGGEGAQPVVEHAGACLLQAEQGVGPAGRCGGLPLAGGPRAGLAELGQDTVLFLVSGSDQV